MDGGKLTIAISTIGSRYSNIVAPAHQGIVYLILVQKPGCGDFDSHKRDDVEVVQLDTVGLSHSRNTAIDRCTTEYLLFADDDHILNSDEILGLQQELQDDVSATFAVGFRSRTAASPQLPQQTAVRWWNAGRICAPEIMIRPGLVRKLAVTFDTAFGVGTTTPIGEDFIFVTDILAAGGRGHSFPIVTGIHSGPSTGDNWQDDSLLKARRAVIKRVFGRWSGVIVPIYAWRHRHRLGSWRRFTQFIRGAL